MVRGMEHGLHGSNGFTLIFFFCVGPGFCGEATPHPSPLPLGEGIDVIRYHWMEGLGVRRAEERN